MKPYLGLALAALLSVAATTALAQQTADLSIIMNDSSATVTPGGDSTYTITITNNGPDTATSLTLNNTPPPALSFVAVTP